jgi:hypothetical protein
LYPAWIDGSFRWADLFRAFNEHRIAWTHLLNLTLFTINGQWDPLTQLFAIAVLRSMWVVGLAAAVSIGRTLRERLIIAAVLGMAFMPQLAWHNVLWGIESHAYFVLIFSTAALAALGTAQRSVPQTIIGLILGVAALFAMGPAALVPVALLGIGLLRLVESRRLDRSTWHQVWPAVLLLALAWLLRVNVPEHASLSSAGGMKFVGALSRLLAWPHVEQPIAAVALNLPIVLLVVFRLMKRRSPAPGEDFVLLVGIWAASIAAATAWVRGGSAEMIAGVPSRYVDFIILLPLANAWSVIVLAREQAVRGWPGARMIAAAWMIFLLVGWSGLSVQMWRNIIAPRIRDRDAPVRLAQEFQHFGNAKVFDGQPRLLVPHPEPEVVRHVLGDPRLRGKLPPSLQLEKPVGPLSRAVRWLIRRQ